MGRPRSTQVYLVTLTKLVWNLRPSKVFQDEVPSGEPSVGRRMGLVWDGNKGSEGMFRHSPKALYPRPLGPVSRTESHPGLFTVDKNHDDLCVVRIVFCPVDTNPYTSHVVPWLPFKYVGIDTYVVDTEIPLLMSSSTVCGHATYTKTKRRNPTRNRRKVSEKNGEGRRKVPVDGHLHEVHVCLKKGE